MLKPNPSVLKALRNSFKFKLFLVSKLPMGWLAGLRLVEINEEKAIVSVPFKYLTKNPFRSIYFACLAMAAELSTGLLGSIYAQGHTDPISMLIVNIQGEFSKKATGKIEFTCADGKLFQSQLQKAIDQDKPQTVTAKSIGKDEAGDLIASFLVTWSFKVKSKKS